MNGLRKRRVRACLCHSQRGTGIDCLILELLQRKEAPFEPRRQDVRSGYFDNLPTAMAA